MTQLTQEERAALAKAAEINQRIATEQEAERRRKEAEAETERQRKEVEAHQTKERKLQAFTETFKSQCPGIGLNAHAWGVTITLPNGNDIKIEAHERNVSGCGCHYEGETYYTIRINGHEVGTDDYGDIRIQN